MAKREDSDEAARLWPFLLPKFERLARGVAGGVSSVSGGAPSPHSLGGSHHEGTLADSQAPQFLKSDGSRSLAGNLAVAAGMTIDGVDISVHAANPAAHHNPVTGGAGIVVAMGQVASVDLAAAPNGLEFVTGKLRVDAGYGMVLDEAGTSVNPAAAFAWTGDHHWTEHLNLGGSIIFDTASEITSLAGSLMIAPVEHLILEPTYDLKLRPINDLVVNPTSNLVTFDSDIEWKSNGFIDDPIGIAGWRLFETPRRNQLTIGGIKADELYVRTFVADAVRVDLGEEVWSKSRGIVAEPFELPELEETVDVWFEDVAGLAHGQIFSVNDWIQFRIIDMAAGIVTQVVWFQVTGGYLDHATEDWQRWTLQRKDGGTTGFEIGRGAACVDWGESGQGYVYLSALQQDGGPFIQTATWAGASPFASGARKVQARMGNLSGLFGYGNVQGFIAAKDASLTDAKDFQGLTLDPTNGLRLFNTTLKSYYNSLQSVNLASNGDFWLGTNVLAPATRSLEFTASTGVLKIKGSIEITGGSGIGALTDAGALATVNNLDGVPDGTTNKKTTASEKAGAGRAASALDGSNRLVTAVIPTTAVTPSTAGLYLDSTHMGYYNGGWKTYISSDGKFYFSGTGSTGLLWDGTKLKGISGGTEQWYASATDGKLYAGAGTVVIDGTGLALEADVTQPLGDSHSLVWYQFPSSRVGVIARMGAVASAVVSRLETYVSHPSGAQILLSATSTGVYGGASSLLVGNDGVEVTGATMVSGTLGVTGNATFSGSVGIGTTPTTMQLHVKDAGRAGLYIEESTGTGTSRVQFGSGSVYHQLRYDWNANALQWINNFVTQITVLANGNVGINTTSPASKLDVNGDIGTAWTTPTLGTDWVAHSSTFYAPGYKRFGDMVILRGVAKRSTGTSGNNTTLFTLASGYRPASKMVALSITANGTDNADNIAFLTIATTGVVTFVGNGRNSVRLDGVAFSIA